MTKSRKEKLDLLIKLDKARTECSWDYEHNCEYHQIKYIKRCSKIISIIDKKCDSIWNQLCKSHKVEHHFKLPLEILEYHRIGCNNNKPDKWNNYERDLERLGIKLPKRT